MKEELLHFVWQAKLLAGKPLYLITGEAVDILHPGVYNRNAGPDFFNARIRIGQTTWAGNIEIHILSSDWKQHGHTADRAYDNVILHVVYHHDTEIWYREGKTIPTLELKSLLPPILLKRFAYLQKSKAAIPCEHIFEKPDELKLNTWLQRLLVERLERKVNDFEILLNSQQQHWENAFYIYTARYFGMKTNAEPFQWLAQRLPLTLLARHLNREDQVLALCLGVAGFLEADEYLHLKQEYQFLKSKYGLQAMDKSVWKFGRTRPANFPDVRIRQLAHLLTRSSHLFSKVLEADTLEKLFALYRDESTEQALTKEAVTLLLLNSVLPVVFLYGKKQDRPGLCERVLGFYEQLEAEYNHILAFWEKMGISAINAGEAQALIELKNQYCDEMKCLSCIIGQNILLHE